MGSDARNILASFSSILQEKKFNRRVAWLQGVGLSSWIMEIISKDKSKILFLALGVQLRIMESEKIFRD